MSCPDWINTGEMSSFYMKANIIKLRRSSQAAPKATWRQQYIRTNSLLFCKRTYSPHATPKNFMAARHLSCLFLIVTCHPFLWTVGCQSFQLQSSALKANTLPAVARFWWIFSRKKGRRESKGVAGLKISGYIFSSSSAILHPLLNHRPHAES